MKMVRVFKVEEIRQMRSVYCQMAVAGLEHIGGSLAKAVLGMDQAMMQRFGLEMGRIRYGGTISCHLESWSIPIEDPWADQFAILREAMSREDLMLTELWRKEKVVLRPGSPKVRRLEKSALVELQSLGTAGDGLTGSIARYHFELPLTDQEYRECRALSPVSAFRLKDVNYVSPGS